MTRDWALSILLFLLTLVTTTLAGWRYTGGHLLEGLWFSFPLLAILVTHELGHYFTARRHGVDVSPPYFIPVPFIGIGTFGAIIRIRSQITDRNALIDIGAAGPWAGMVVAVPLMIYGLSMSEVRPVLPVPGAMTEGNSILYLALKYAVHGRILPSGGYDVYLHPTAFAAWIGFLVTMINLIPIGQLDGGHVAVGYFGNRYARFSLVLLYSLPVLALLAGAYAFVDDRMGGLAAPAALSDAVTTAFPWFLWFLILLLMRRLSGGRLHPPVSDREPTPARRMIAIATGILFVLIFMPIPMRVS